MFWTREPQTLGSCTGWLLRGKALWPRQLSVVPLLGPALLAGPVLTRFQPRGLSLEPGFPLTPSSCQRFCLTRGCSPNPVYTLKPVVCASHRLWLCRPITLEMRNVWQSEVWVIPHPWLPCVAALRDSSVLMTPC